MKNLEMDLDKAERSQSKEDLKTLSRRIKKRKLSYNDEGILFLILMVGFVILVSVIYWFFFTPILQSIPTALTNANLIKTQIGNTLLNNGTIIPFYSVSSVSETSIVLNTLEYISYAIVMILLYIAIAYFTYYVLYRTFKNARFDFARIDYSCLLCESHFHTFYRFKNHLLANHYEKLVTETIEED